MPDTPSVRRLPWADLPEAQFATADQNVNNQEATTAVVPLPPAVLSGAVTLFAAAVVGLRNRSRRLSGIRRR